MKLNEILETVKDKNKFLSLTGYRDFCLTYLKFLNNQKNFQATIVSKNETNYIFYQYKNDGHFNITRPINKNLMYTYQDFKKEESAFFDTMDDLRKNKNKNSCQNRENFIRTIYTIQQSIGGALDAISSGSSNTAKKLNGMFFENLVRLLINELNVDCVSGTMKVPIIGEDKEILCNCFYQHDLVFKKDEHLKLIGSVKTSSKDRIDKIFMDKFLFSKLTDSAIPHIAIFLNDVQRKKKNEINSTFLSGHFKAYSIKLNSLDGVYYCDIRPNMKNDAFFIKKIKTVDHFFFSDLWNFLDEKGSSIQVNLVENTKKEEGTSDEEEEDL